MSSSPLAFESLCNLRALLGKGEIASVDVVKACLRQISTHGERTNAFTEVFEDDALTQARYSDELRARQGATGSLHGVPVVVKDLFDIAGRVNTGGTAIRKGEPAALKSAAAVAALERAGAIIIGKANLDELAFGVASANEHFGYVNNPWGDKLIPGGSSGGSAVALASGMAYVALGSDTGGSVRIPAAFTGTAALKVTPGLISTAGCIGVSTTLDSVGPMARTVADLSIPLALLQQTSNMRAKPSTPHMDFKRLRLGIDEQYYMNTDRMSGDCQKIMSTVLSDLQKKGVELVPIKLPSIEYAEAAQKSIVLAEAAHYHSGDRRVLRQHYGKIIKPNLALGDFVLASDYLTAMNFRLTLAKEYAAAFDAVDFIVAPGVPFSACEHDIDEYTWPDGSASHIFDAAWRSCFPSNLIGIPSLCQPCGLTDAGLPIGLQLIAPPLAEQNLLSVGAMLEREFNWYFKAPGI